MDKAKFNHLVSNLVAADVPALIALQQAKKLGSFSFGFGQCKETQYLRFFAHSYN